MWSQFVWASQNLKIWMKNELIKHVGQEFETPEERLWVDDALFKKNLMNYQYCYQNSSLGCLKNWDLVDVSKLMFKTYVNGFKTGLLLRACMDNILKQFKLLLSSLKLRMFMWSLGYNFVRKDPIYNSSTKVASLIINQLETNALLQ